MFRVDRKASTMGVEAKNLPELQFISFSTGKVPFYYKSNKIFLN